MENVETVVATDMDRKPGPIELIMEETGCPIESMRAYIKFNFFNGEEWKDFMFQSEHRFDFKFIELGSEKHNQLCDAVKLNLKKVVWRAFHNMMEEGSINTYEIPEGEEEEQLVKHLVLAVARDPIIMLEGE